MKGFMFFNVVLVLFVFNGVAMGKECTNIPTVLSSHSFRYELLVSDNETWKDEMFSRYHLTPTDDSVWSNLLPKEMRKEEDDEPVGWAMMYRKVKDPTRFNVQRNFLKEVSLHDVRLESSSIYGRAQQSNLEYLLMLDVDSLVWSFRKNAGLVTRGKAYGGWEAPNVELRGHFVGHYLSATAQMWASTHNDNLKRKMSAVVSALSICQKKIGTGYLSAFPSEQFDRFEAIKPVWAPYYTIHKIMAGLLDQYTFTGNAQALKMVTWMANYFYTRVRNVISKYSIERHWESLNEETGGMNDVLYKLFILTGDPKNLVLAHLFDKPCFLGLLAMQADDISGFHANTHIPVVIGSQLRYEITGDPLYKEIGSFFMDVVNSSHAYATGGTSVDEFWSEPKRLASTLWTENEESCTTYNMLKVSRNLFRWTKEMGYADYYERALINGVLGIQRGTEPGVMIYMLPLAPGASKATSLHGWGTKFDSFWCCYGTGIESFSKLGDSIYFEEEGKVPGLFVIQYVSSSLDWKSGRISVNQTVDPVVSWDPYLRVTFTFSSKQSTQGAGRLSTLNFRVPIWTHLNGAKATLNSQSVTLPAPGKFLSVTRKWGPDDMLTLQLPLSLHTEAIKDDRVEFASIQAILYGPYVLSGRTSGDWNMKTGGSPDSFSDWITPIPANYNDYLITFTQEFGDSTFVLTNSNQSITMEKYPESGTNEADHATFRLILIEESTSKLSYLDNFIGKSAMLEPFDYPGKLLLHGPANSLVVGDGSYSGFHIIPGLDGNGGTVSLESVKQKGCFIYSGVRNNPGATVMVSCKTTESSDSGFNRMVSFRMKKGISEYHPISFVAKGSKQNFLMAPLLSFRDESYSVYFNIQSKS